MLDKQENKSFKFFQPYFHYIFAVGLILFGFFAINFQTFEHPVYGYINLGEYHVLIGVASFILGMVYIVYIKRKKK